MQLQLLRFTGLGDDPEDPGTLATCEGLDRVGALEEDTGPVVEREAAGQPPPHRPEIGASAIGVPRVVDAKASFEQAESGRGAR